MKTLLIEQMELTIDGKQKLNLVDARASKVRRGQFWFNKMRQIVDLALPAKQFPSLLPNRHTWTSANPSTSGQSNNPKSNTLEQP
jgi:hypothetical protein